MRKKTAAVAAACILLLCAAFGAPICHADSEYVEKDTSWFDHEDTKKTYTIRTEAQLMGLASLVNEEQTDKWKPTRIENFEDVTFILARDIKLTRVWTPIGKGGASYFAGTFDGNGHTISGLRVDASAEYSGLFGFLSGEVKDLTVEGKVTSEYSACGGIAGYVSSTGNIIGCTGDVNVTGTDKAGGIAGFNDGGTVEGCINTGNVSGTHKVGGVVGENWGGKIIACGNKGTVKSSRRGVSTYGTGGVAGRSVSAEAAITESYNTGDIISYTEATGGVTGYANAKGAAIEDCYSTGKITITEDKEPGGATEAYAGGIVGIAGTNGVIIKNCYSTDIIENADAAGGIIGLYINDKRAVQQSIVNNYYLKGSCNSGIGEIRDDNDPHLTNAVTDVPAGAMNRLYSSLSPKYMKDTGYYGNDGYPVLTWQEPVDDEEDFPVDIPAEKRKALDRYLLRTASATPPGQSIINFFQPENIMSNAFIVYMEAKEKSKEHIGDDIKNEQDAAE